MTRTWPTLCHSLSLKQQGSPQQELYSAWLRCYRHKNFCYIINIFLRRFLHWQRPTHFQSVLPPQSLSESMLWPNNFCLQFYLTCLIYSDDERSTLLKAVITGPEETPYTGGVFEFHIYFPNKYPAVPPKVPQATCSNLYPLFCRFPSEPLGMGRCASTQTFTTMER